MQTEKVYFRLTRFSRFYVVGLLIGVSMYCMLMCQTPLGAESALTSYDPDRMPTGFRRNWITGKRFATVPAEPIRVEVEEGESGLLLELITGAIPLMTRRLANALTGAGIGNIDFFEAEIHDLETEVVHRSHLAFNLIGDVAAADLGKSVFQAHDGPMISVDFDSLAIDESKTRGALMFRLAESVNGIVVHDSIKNAVEAAGIDTLRFLPPPQWVG